MLKLFNHCLTADWRTAGLDTQYAVIEQSDKVILSFQGSNSDIDWKHNFSFWARPYKDQPVPWWAHAGFVKAWKAAERQIAADVLPILNGRKLYIAGYSHGGALAVLAHEYFFWKGENPYTFAFGAPRVLWLPSQKVLQRFNHCFIIRAYGDLVGHVPPALLGYRHTSLISIGVPGLPSVERHKPEWYRGLLWT